MSEKIFEGGCTCGAVRYRMLKRPMYIHCCHCSWCRRASGAAFGFNGMIEGSNIELLHGDVKVVDTPTKSGNGQKISRCPECSDMLWSNLSKAGQAINFLRLGTLDKANLFSPDVHIYTASKLPRIEIPKDIPSFEAFYVKAEMWTQESIRRYDKAVDDYRLQQA